MDASNRVESATMAAKGLAVTAPRAQSAMREEAVILFAELRNFTRMSEMLDAARVLALADEFFECAARAVLANGGQPVGVHNDSLVAAFRVGGVAEQSRAALRAAKNLAGEFDAVGQSWERDFGLRAAVALGVHHGQVVFGEAGPAGARSPVVFGDSVSIAERLVHRARAGEIVLSHAVMGVVSVAELELEAQPLPPLELHQRPPVRIYGVLRNDRLDFTS